MGTAELGATSLENLNSKGLAGYLFYNRFA